MLNLLENHFKSQNGTYHNTSLSVNFIQTMQSIHFVCKVLKCREKHMPSGAVDRSKQGTTAETFLSKYCLLYETYEHDLISNIVIHELKLIYALPA